MARVWHHNTHEEHTYVNLWGGEVLPGRTSIIEELWEDSLEQRPSGFFDRLFFVLSARFSFPHDTEFPDGSRNQDGTTSKCDIITCTRIHTYVGKYVNNETRIIEDVREDPREQRPLSLEFRSFVLSAHFLFPYALLLTWMVQIPNSAMQRIRMSRIIRSLFHPLPGAPGITSLYWHYEYFFRTVWTSKLRQHTPANKWPRFKDQCLAVNLLVDRDPFFFVLGEWTGIKLDMTDEQMKRAKGPRRRAPEFSYYGGPQ